MYAVLDIETTGGKYNEEGITEIAIYRFDGHKIVDQFASLVNPERPIQPFVVNLTGINNNMLRQAPKFYEVAKRIIEITDGCVMVAHNALFDNRILTTEFDRLGYNFQKETLCTVELAKKLIPDMPSYSLGKLVKALGIPLSDRHRAQGDAKATVALFKLLLNKDNSKEIIAETLRKEIKPELNPKMLDIIESTPSETGVYYMHNSAGEIIFIGRSKNIRKKLIQHFTNDNRKSKRLQLEVKKVTYEKTGNELISMLKEHLEIRLNKPRYNKIQRRSLYTHQLTSFVDNNGYLNLKIDKSDGRKKALITFSNYQQAKSELLRITQENELCPKLTGLQDSSENCSYYSIEKCAGACINNESPESYNKRVLDFLNKESFEKWNKLLIDRGRETEERSVIWIENGKYRGYAFYDLNYQITKPEILRTIINLVDHSRESQHIIQNYLRRNKTMKLINLSPISGK
ncbi:exonuclease domain-containing protein [Aequorivita viscosa]|uniref:DNA polymerase-3 subunit epsilon n=1 Tax=Aequorivita viscosa TaxID=797419 RepID=A0A1M6IU12_9FLAO|nr:exonuclease domain-containing protein [Aequorivita viscosa]SDX14249.1 DNA polymerase-3 subunit epsilon [Aequorivita viscosa]SHJ37926.1 DNA polymerase-3 subunit epsilon [Aequorivita viscosa]